MELLVVLVVVAVLVGAVTVALAGSRDKAESRAVAEMLAEEMRLARQKAIAEGAPVGVLFPNQGGAVPIAQGFYTMEGWDPKTPARVQDYSREAPDTYLFNGFWELDPQKLSDPTSRVTTSPPDTGTNADQVAGGSWGGTGSDFAYVFTPSGTVQTNELPLFDGHYHIVVTQAIAYEASDLQTAMADDGWLQAVVQPGQWFKLTGVSKAWTLNISPLGEITVTEGVTGARDESVRDLGDSAPPPPSPPAPLPALPGTTANQDPTLDSVTLLPSPNPATLPSGVDATVGKDLFLTAQVQGTDPDGDPPTLNWTATGGAFSMPTEVPMVWDAGQDAWTGGMAWQPPETASGGDRFTLTATMRDERGGTATVSKVVEILDGRILFPNYTAETGEGLFVVNSDGTGLSLVSVANNPSGPSAQPIDYPFLSSSTGQLTYTYYTNNHDRDIRIRGIDGSGDRAVLSGSSYPVVGHQFQTPRVSPDGRRIVFTAYPKSYPRSPEAHLTKVDSLVYTARLDGSDLSPVSQVGASRVFDEQPVWSPDGRQLVFYRTTGVGLPNSNPQSSQGRSSLFVVRSDGSEAPKKLIDWQQASMGGGIPASWTTDGSRVLVAVRDGPYGGGQQRILSVDPTNGSIEEAYEFSGDGIVVCWTGSLSKVIVYSPGSDELSLFDTAGSTSRVILDSSVFGGTRQYSWWQD